MIEKDNLDTPYTSTEQDLIEAFEQSPDILKVLEDKDGRISIIQSDEGNVVHNYIIVDLKWSKSKDDTPFYPTFKCSTPKDFLEIDFSKNGYTVNVKNYRDNPIFGITNKQERVKEIMDIAQRGINMIQIFRNIPINKRSDIRNRYIRNLDCNINDTPEPTLDCLALTSRAIELVKRGEIKEITSK